MLSLKSRFQKIEKNSNLWETDRAVLRGERKRLFEYVFIFFINGIMGAVLSGYFYYIGLQVLSIITLLGVVIWVVCALFFQGRVDLVDFILWCKEEGV